MPNNIAPSRFLPASFGPTPPGSWWKPTPNITWQWQLTGPVDQSIKADVYDIDLFDNDKNVVDSLHKKGRKVICYISVGAWENWRPDANQFPQSVIGKDYRGWPGEKWLDIRKLDILGPLLEARFDMCKQKGFDAIEPDNIDGYGTDTGFPLTYQDQMRFNTFIAQKAHERGLSIGLKNDNDQVQDLLADFDWAMTEDCFDQGWCTDVKPFTDNNKAVFMAEYSDTGAKLSKFCPTANNLKFSGILKKRNLDAFRQSCK